MTNIQSLREKNTHLASSAKNLLLEKGSATWSIEDQTKFDGITNEIELVRGQIRAEEKMRELEADNFFNAAVGSGKTVEVDIENMSTLAATAMYLRFGNNVTPEVAVQIRNAMSTTTTTEGGYTVPAEIAAMVIDKMKAFGGMRQVATQLTTAGGNALNFPTSDPTSDIGEIVSENTGAALGEIVFGTVALPVFKYSSKKIALPVELIQDSAIDIVAYVVERLAMRIARIQNTHFTTGTGTTLPDGIVPKSGQGKAGTTGQTLTVIYDDLVDLKYSVNRAYRANATFMMNDLSIAVISKIKESTTGRPIWEYSTQVDAPDSLLGHAVVTNDDIAVMAASAKSIIFGDLSKYTIRDVANSTSLRRFDDSAFALLGQVGFCGWTRSGGNLLDVNAVKHYVNSGT
jgi:HK97 family phage major capsid protein